MNPYFLRVALSLAMTVTAAALPAITKMSAPATNSVSLGASLTNRVTAATTAPPLTYQWRLSGLPLPSATNAMLLLTNIGTANAGVYSVLVGDGSGSIESQPWTIEVDPAFTKITSGPVVAVSSSAAAWADFDNDGREDLFLTVNGGSNVLCHNNGDGTFKSITPSPVVLAAGQTFGCAWADFDNDGFLDLLRGVYNGNDQLFRNNRDGTFTALKSPALPASGSGANNVLWGDYDNDGFIDLFAANGYGSTRNTLFRNLGNGTFVRITNNVCVPATGQCLGASWGDYDNDGWLDLVLTKNGGKTLLFQNNRNGQFSSLTNVITTDVVTGGSFAGPSWADYDNDGFLDLLITGADGQHSALYHNDGQGSFTKVLSTPISIPSASSTGGAWADYDNDGRLDLFVANQHGQASFLYHNEGGGTFKRILTGSLATDLGECQGAAWADFDNDGFPDLLAPNIRNGVKNFLYRNNGNSNHWLSIRCEGRQSNRAAIGAKVRVHAVIDGIESWQLREISGGGSLGSQNDLRCLFGLGDATQAGTVRIEWPSGIVQELHNVAARQFVTVTEPPRVSIEMSLPSGELNVLLEGGGMGIRYDLETSTNLTHWTSLGPLVYTDTFLSWTNRFVGQTSAAFFRARER